MQNILEIEGDDELYRRLARKHISPDGVPNSLAFKLRGRPDPSASVDLARLTTPTESLSRAPAQDFRLGVLVAGTVRGIQLAVRHNPNPENAAHSLIEGAHTKEHCRKLAGATRILDL